MDALLLFTRAQEFALLALATFGLLVPSGVVPYFAVLDPASLAAALGNPAGLVFIVEAFALMFVVAWLIRRFGSQSPVWLAFIAMSPVGSLLFRIPAFLSLASRRVRQLGLA